MAPLTMADFADCIDTLERTTAELLALEAKLAAEYRLPTDYPRQWLLDMDARGKLDDTPLVSDWRATYARYLDWCSPRP